MTTSRVIRGTKAKIFLYVCAILVITGLIACYNNTLSQLDEVKKAYEICHQQQENLSTQLQVISDYKQKLEKSLKNEKAEHLHSKNNLEVKINEEKSRSEKLSNDALIKYNSLQQHYSLLQTQHDDFKEETSKMQKKQLDEINSLQSKLSEVEEELKKIKASKESLKTRFAELEVENQELKSALDKKATDNESQRTIQFFSDKFHDLEERHKALQQRCGEIPRDTLQEPSNVETENRASEKSIQNPPSFKIAEKPSTSTKAVPKISPSQGNLNGARPLLLPSITPESAKKESNLKPPQGVPAVPENRENQNEQPEVQLPKKVDKVEDPEKDNGAHEEFDLPQNNLDGLGFNDDGLKPAHNLEMKHVDSLRMPEKKHDDLDYKDMQREEEGDDDVDDYVDHQARLEGQAIRH